MLTADLLANSRMASLEACYLATESEVSTFFLAASEANTCEQCKFQDRDQVIAHLATTAGIHQ